MGCKPDRCGPVVSWLTAGEECILVGSGKVEVVSEGA